MGGSGYVVSPVDTRPLSHGFD